MKEEMFMLAALLVSSTAFAQAYVGIAGGATKGALSCDNRNAWSNRSPGT